MDLHREYTEEIVSGKSIVFYTTNGSKAIAKAKFSDNLFVCSFSNITALADHLVRLNLDFEILCAGRNNGFSMEDSICAGKLIARVHAFHCTKLMGVIFLKCLKTVITVSY